MPYLAVCPVEELPVGARRTVRVGGRSVVVLHLPEGMFAVDDRCPHRGGLLSQGDLEGVHLYCPLHAWRFDVRTGACPELPGVCVARYAVRVAAGMVEVSDEGTWAA
jgi:nitrite reductase (NADH) small subunit